MAPAVRAFGALTSGLWYVCDCFAVLSTNIGFPNFSNLRSMPSKRGPDFLDG